MTKKKYCFKEFISDISKPPNWLTFLRIVGFFFFLLPLIRQDDFIIAFTVFILLEATDFIDGELARRKNMVTWLGKGLDPAADKVLLIGAIFALGIINAYPVPGLLLISFESLLLVMGIVAFFGKKRSIVLGANLFGKTKVILEVIIISFAFLARLNIFLAANNLILFIFWAATAAAALSILGHLGLLKFIMMPDNIFHKSA